MVLYIHDKTDKWTEKSAFQDFIKWLYRVSQKKIQHMLL
jgi:hypothetical protein